MSAIKELDLILALNKTSSRFSSELDRYFESRLGVTFMQALVLYQLTVLNRPGTMELTRSLGSVYDGPVSNIITRLEKVGLVNREPRQVGRSVIIRLTATGSELALQVEDLLTAKLKELFSPLTDAEVETLFQLISKIR